MDWSTFGSGTLRAVYSKRKLTDSVHCFTIASSFTIFTRLLYMSKFIRENRSAWSLRSFS